MKTEWERLTYPRLCGVLAEQPTKLGQAMHNAGFKSLGLPFTFVAFPLTAGNEGIAVAAMRQMGIRGFSVTIPHKERIAAGLDELSADAREIGAVNTVINDGARLHGFNTDLYGIVEAFKEAKVELKGKRALLLGAGGAARAAVVALKRSGIGEIIVANRDAKRAENLACEFGVSSQSFSEFGKAPWSSIDLLINATPFGNQADLRVEDYPFDIKRLTSRVVVFDMVTKETPLTVASRKAGLTVISGPRMLLFQALEQFRLFTDNEAPRAAMEAALSATL